MCKLDYCNDDINCTTETTQQYNVNNMPHALKFKPMTETFDDSIEKSRKKSR